MPFGDRVGLLRGGAMIRWLKTSIHECKSVCLWCHAETDMISYNLLHIVSCHVRTSFCVCVLLEMSSLHWCSCASFLSWPSGALHFAHTLLRTQVGELRCRGISIGSARTES